MLPRTILLRLEQHPSVVSALAVRSEIDCSVWNADRNRQKVGVTRPGTIRAVLRRFRGCLSIMPWCTTSFISPALVVPDLKHMQCDDQDPRKTCLHTNGNDLQAHNTQLWALATTIRVSVCPRVFLPATWTWAGFLTQPHTAACKWYLD